MSKYIVRASLNPIPGPRFQPTGFPDLGAATYEVPDGDGGWVDGLLIESAQSMANRLEGMAWNDGTNGPVDQVAGLPWVRVVSPAGEYLTSSRTEAHRLASAFVRNAIVSDDKTMLEHTKDLFGLEKDKPISRQHVAAEIMKLDPMCLVHGVFFSDKAWLGQPKFARAVTGAIEARNVKAVHSGGVKHDHVSHLNVEGQGSSEGYGTVPFHRTEYTAQLIEAAFSIDRRLLVSYGLSAEATDLLFALAQWEIASFLDSGMRLRTACEFEVADLSGDPLPDVDALAATMNDLIGKADELEGVRGQVTEVVWSPKK